MNTVPIVWYTTHADILARGPWDTALLEAMFEEDLWPHGWKAVHHDIYTLAPADESRAVVVVPARHHAGTADVAALNGYLAHYKGVLLILVGDEEAIFPWRDVQHPNIKFWVMLPRPDVHQDMADWAFFFGDGWPPDTPDLLEVTAPSKDVPWSFAGQVTHQRRKQAVSGLQRAQRISRGMITRTEGFTQGLPRPEYMKLLERTKIAPCPSGPCTPDSFRFYEALEAGCVPIADATTPAGWLGYWNLVYGENLPFPIVENWAEVDGVITDELRQWPANANACSAWWQQQKRRMVERFDSDLQDIGLRKTPSADWRDSVTVVLTTSPIPSHPSTDMILETLDSIWAQMGDVQIILAIDGVRDEQLDMKPAYDEYVRQLLWMSGHQYRNLLPVLHGQHLHQALSTRAALDFVHTPVMLFMEHDTPLSDDPIDWEHCVNLVEWGGVDVLRFSHEAQIHPEHQYLALDHQTVEMMGVPVRRTLQFSARPHLARTAWYRDALAKHFTESSRTCIEDRMHGVCQTKPPSENRIAIYHPEGSIRRSLHTDGRGDAPKFAMRY